MATVNDSPAKIHPSQEQRDKAAARLVRQGAMPCPECAGRGCTPDAEGNPVRCPVCKDPGASKATHRSLADAMRNAPEEFPSDSWDSSDPSLDEMWTVAQFPDDLPPGA